MDSAKELFREKIRKADLEFREADRALKECAQPVIANSSELGSPIAFEARRIRLFEAERICGGLQLQYEKQFGELYREIDEGV